MDWHLVSTLYIASLLLLSSQVSVSGAALVQADARLQPVIKATDAIAIVAQLTDSEEEMPASYKPPRDIGRPRRTGPSGGRIA